MKKLILLIIPFLLFSCGGKEDEPEISTLDKSNVEMWHTLNGTFVGSYSVPAGYTLEQWEEAINFTPYEKPIKMTFDKNTHYIYGEARFKWTKMPPNPTVINSPVVAYYSFPAPMYISFLGVSDYPFGEITRYIAVADENTLIYHCDNKFSNSGLILYSKSK